MHAAKFLSILLYFCRGKNAFTIDTFATGAKVERRQLKTRHKNLGVAGRRPGRVQGRMPASNR